MTEMDFRMNVDNELLHELKELRDSHLHRTLRKVESEQCPRIVIDGRPCINLCSNNYLGLSNHPSLKEASINAVKKYGTGAGASRLVSGNMEIHEMLESVTAKFKGTEDALLFNSGYMANTGMIQAIASEGDAIFSDELKGTLIVDDAHATGVLGSTGRGSFEHFGINSDSHIQMGTYSKALGSFGGYVA